MKKKIKDRIEEKKKDKRKFMYKLLTQDQKNKNSI